MRHLLAVAFLYVAAVPCASQAADDAPVGAGPRLLASGDGYAIHLFRGMVEPPPADSVSEYSLPVRPGVVIFHTDLDTRKSTWLVHTGIRSLPTRRVSYAISRVVGLHLTNTQLAVVRYDVRKVFSYRMPPPEKGTYRVVVFDRKTGKRVLHHVLVLTTHRPEKVPEETTGSGVIRHTKRGFTVLGEPFVLHRDGKITRGE